MTDNDPWGRPPGEQRPPAGGHGAPGDAYLPPGQPRYGAPGGQPPYGGYGYGYGYGYGQVPSVRRNGLGIASLVLGIIAVVFCWTIVLGVVCGILAVIFGIIGRRRATRGEATNGGLAIGGIVTGAIGFMLAAALVGFGVAFFQSPAAQNYRQCLQQAHTQADRNQCADQFRRKLGGG